MNLLFIHLKTLHAKNIYGTDSLLFSRLKSLIVTVYYKHFKMQVLPHMSES